MLRSVTFEVLADAEAGLLPRVLVPFARRDLAPDVVKARRFGDVIQATVVVETMPAGEISLVEGNLRQIIGMRRVEVVLRGSVQAVA